MMGLGTQLTYSVHSGATADIGREVVFVNQPVPLNFFDPMPASTVQNIRVYLNGDRRDEPEESFVVDLRTTGGGLPGGTSAITVKLTSADAPLPTQLGFDKTTISQAENQTTVNLTVNRTGGGTGAVTVHYETAAGTATAGSDFTATSGDLQWAAGDTSAKTIAVTLINDTTAESTESFTVKLSAPTGGATLASDTATISITDDDTASSSGGGGGGGSSSGGGGGGGAFDSLSLLALGLIFVFGKRTALGRRAASTARMNALFHVASNDRLQVTAVLEPETQRAAHIPARRPARNDRFDARVAHPSHSA
jgi:Calx-beta domain